MRKCRYSSSVERELPKLDRRVRFPLPAPSSSRTAYRSRRFYFSLIVKKEAVAMQPLPFCVCNQPHRADRVGTTCFLRDMMPGRNAQLSSGFRMLNA